MFHVTHHALLVTDCLVALQGKFLIESWKLVDCRDWDTSFRDIITPRIEVSESAASRKRVLSDIPMRHNNSSNILTLDDDERQKPSVVGRLASEQNKQLTMTYERHKDGTQEVNIAMDHCYIICIPDAIFDIWGFVRPLVFEDIMKISEVWYAHAEKSCSSRRRIRRRRSTLTIVVHMCDALARRRNWRNPDPVILVAPADQTQELKMKIVITNPELCLLEDPAIPETKAIVIVCDCYSSLNNHVDVLSPTHHHIGACLAFDIQHHIPAKQQD
jgi:hypothetical protein